MSINKDQVKNPVGQPKDKAAETPGKPAEALGTPARKDELETKGKVPQGGAMPQAKPAEVKHDVKDAGKHG